MRRIFSGGKLDFVQDAIEIGSPGTIISLRKGEDSFAFGANYYHFPISNDYEKYKTQTPEVRQWLRTIFLALQEEITDYPILFHCMSGKDRTGVVIAVLLKVLGMERAWIIKEYLVQELPSDHVSGGRRGPVPRWTRCPFCINLPDASQGHAVLTLEGDKVSLESFSEGSCFRHQ